MFKSESLINAEFVGSSEKIDEIQSSLDKLKPLEIVRTGLSGISSSSRTQTI